MNSSIAQSGQNELRWTLIRVALGDASSPGWRDGLYCFFFSFLYVAWKTNQTLLTEKKKKAIHDSKYRKHGQNDNCTWYLCMESVSWRSLGEFVVCYGTSQAFMSTWCDRSIQIDSVGKYYHTWAGDYFIVFVNVVRWRQSIETTWKKKKKKNVKNSHTNETGLLSLCVCFIYTVCVQPVSKSAEIKNIKIKRDLKKYIHILANVHDQCLVYSNCRVPLRGGSVHNAMLD